MQIPEDKSSLATVSSAATSSGDWAPQTLVQESEFGYLLQALLPGVKARDVRAELVPGSRLVISGTRRGRMGGPFPELFAALPEVFGLAKGPGTQGMASGSFEIVWRLPGDANLDSLRAEVKVREGANAADRMQLLLGAKRA